jgi:hypothetical protein
MEEGELQEAIRFEAHKYILPLWTKWPWVGRSSGCGHHG